MVATREEVYKAIDSERDYQDSKWNASTYHSLYEWLVYLQDYLTEGIHQASRLPDKQRFPLVLDTVRKIGAMCVSAMEQHGAPYRTSGRPHSL